MALRRQYFLLSYLKTLSVGPVEVWTCDLPQGSPVLRLPTELIGLFKNQRSRGRNCHLFISYMGHIFGNCVKQDGNNSQFSIRREKLARKREPARDRSFQPAGVRVGRYNIILLLLRTFALIVTAHPYCARKFTCHVMHERALSHKINKWARAHPSFAWI